MRYDHGAYQTIRGHPHLMPAISMALREYQRCKREGIHLSLEEAADQASTLMDVPYRLLLLWLYAMICGGHRGRASAGAYTTPPGGT